METIRVRNQRLRDLQCTVSYRGSKIRDKAVHVVTWPRPSGLKVSIGILSPMQTDPPCTALFHPTEPCPHRRKFQVIFGNRDRGELGVFLCSIC